MFVSVHPCKALRLSSGNKNSKRAEPKSRRRGLYAYVERHHSTYVSSLPQFHMTSFISKFVRPHGVLLFQNKHICLAIYGPQCECLMIHEWRNEAEMLYFHSKLPDPARVTKLGTPTKKCTCLENNFCPSLLAKSQKKVNLPKRLATGEISAILCRRYDNCFDVANLYS